MRFGVAEAAYTHPPAGALVDSVDGYDGQFFWPTAQDPLLLRDRTVAALRGAGQAFRLQRMAYPLLAFALAGGEPGAVPWTLLAINALTILVITAGFVAYARRRDVSPWWGLAVGLLPGMLTGVLRDLSDPLAVASMLGGLIMWQLGRRWWAAGLLTIAVLAREPMMLAVAAVTVELIAVWWRDRRQPGALVRAARRAWPVPIVPLAAFSAWQVYIDVRYGGNVAATGGSSFVAPATNFVAEVSHALGKSSPLAGGWDLVYLALTLGAILTALALLRRRVTAAGVAAALFGMSLLVLDFGDDWSYTRLSAPLFVALLMAGLERRSRFTLSLCATVAATGALIPLAITG